ncbi:MAG: hypothetical protein CM1200mP2_18860 [Planctomycetaceae bacterium]|nr:MAG: hypothetical protein CM1200mP2_18860 [Planctomycetaceae bacterium]
MEVLSLHPGVTLEEVQQQTGFEIGAASELIGTDRPVSRSCGSPARKWIRTDMSSDDDRRRERRNRTCTDVRLPDRPWHHGKAGCGFCAAGRGGTPKGKPLTAAGMARDKKNAVPYAKPKGLRNGFDSVDMKR